MLLGLAARRLSRASRHELFTSLKNQHRTPTPKTLPIAAAIKIVHDIDRVIMCSKSKKTWYAVVRGRVPGVYSSWSECAVQVKGFKDNLYKGFTSKNEATEYLSQYSVDLNAISSKKCKDKGEREDRGQNPTQSVNRLTAVNTLTLLDMDAVAVVKEIKTTFNEDVKGSAVLNFDGASKRNPGPAAFGAVLYDKISGKEYARIRGYMGDYHTNNQAEYAGLIVGLQTALELRFAALEVLGDSTLIVNQILGIWKVKNKGLIPFHKVACLLKDQFTSFSAQQVPRAENTIADGLGNQAIEEWNLGMMKGKIPWTINTVDVGVVIGRKKTLQRGGDQLNVDDPDNYSLTQPMKKMRPQNAE